MRKMLLILCATVWLHAVQAYDYQNGFDATDRSTWPVIAVIIDDIGNNRAEGRRAVALPGPVAYAVLPHTPFGAELAEAAHAQGKEVMLHQPLQATEDNHLLGAGAITLEQSFEEVSATFMRNLEAVPHVSGVNNHMGSLLTRHPEHMRWLMTLIDQQGELFFVDSRTTGHSLAYQAAQDFQLPRLRRDVFLDSQPSYEAVAQQFERLKQHARRYGYAVAIGHPMPSTMRVLERELPRLEGLGYRLISIRSMIEQQAAMSVRGGAADPRSRAAE